MGGGAEEEAQGVLVSGRGGGRCEGHRGERQWGSEEHKVCVVERRGMPMLTRCDVVHGTGESSWRPLRRNDVDNLEREIIAFIEREGLPVDCVPSKGQLIAAGRRDIAKAIERFGGVKEVADMVRGARLRGLLCGVALIQEAERFFEGGKPSRSVDGVHTGEATRAS